MRLVDKPAELAFHIIVHFVYLRTFFRPLIVPNRYRINNSNPVARCKESLSFCSNTSDPDPRAPVGMCLVPDLGTLRVFTIHTVLNISELKK